MDNNSTILSNNFTEYRPVILEDNINLKDYKSIPIGQFSALGLSFESIAAALNSISTAGGGSGLYWVKVPSGTHLAALKNGSGYIGGALSNTTNQVAAQSTLSKLAFNPTMLFISIALTSVMKKIDQCVQIGNDIMHYLEEQEKAKIVGSINFLTEVLNNYKFNWDNKRYVESNLANVVNIRKQAVQSIALHKSRLEELLKSKSKIHSTKEVYRKHNSIITILRNYQLALYMFSFSSFLEVLLNENFKTDYVNSVIETISGYSLDYRKIYTDCYNHLEKFSKSSLQTIIVDNASSISKFAGNTIAKIPVISKTQIDENLVAIGDKLNVYSDNKTDDIMEQLIKLKDDNTLVFINNIKEIDSIFNKQIKMLFDKENIYYNVAL